MKHNPDDRNDNVGRIRENIDNTIDNMKLADEMIEDTSDEKMKRELHAKNKRREAALDSMKEEIRDEAKARKNK